MPSPDNFKYISLASQILATLGVAFFIGYHIDKYFGLQYPVVMISLPLLTLLAMLWKIIKDTSNNKNK